MGLEVLQRGIAVRRVPVGFSREVLLGAGRSGRAWRAREDDIGRMVCLKETPCRTAADREALRREAAATDSAAVSCLPRLHAVEFGPGRGWIVQEYIHGISIESLRQAGLEPEEARWIAWSAIEAVSSLHGAQRAHGDLDPGHLLVEPSGRVRMIDLGLSASKTESVKGGSSGYLPPEAGTSGASPLASEIWALGVLLHELLCGTRPGPRGPDLDALSRHGDRWREAVLACLTPIPSARPGARSLLDGLGGADPLPPLLLGRVAVQADVELARRLKEGGRECLSRRDARGAWDRLQEAANLDPDDGETLALLGQVRLDAGRRNLAPWIALGAFAVAFAIACAWWYLRPDAPEPVPAAPRHSIEDRIQMAPERSAPLPLREGRTP